MGSGTYWLMGPSILGQYTILVILLSKSQKELIMEKGKSTTNFHNRTSALHLRSSFIIKALLTILSRSRGSTSIMIEIVGQFHFLGDFFV